jgi:hypothetical protein
MSSLKWRRRALACSVLYRRAIHARWPTRTINSRGARPPHGRRGGVPAAQGGPEFLKLQDELTGTENRIAVARTDYNNAVQTYNTYIRTLPQSLTAKVTGAKARDYFEVTTPGARTAPTVDFSKPAAKP